MHKHRLCLKGRSKAAEVDRGESMEQIEKRGPETKQEAALLKAWQKKQKPQNLRPRGRPYHNKNSRKVSRRGH